MMALKFEGNIKMIKKMEKEKNFIVVQAILKMNSEKKVEVH